MQARARVLMDTRVDALRRWQELDGERRAQRGAGRALGALTRARWRRRCCATGARADAR